MVGDVRLRGLVVGYPSYRLGLHLRETFLSLEGTTERKGCWVDGISNKYKYRHRTGMHSNLDGKMAWQGEG